MKTSLIFTIKNEEKNLGQLLYSILSQSKRPDELVIVDGGSTDNSMDILEQFCIPFKEAGIHYIYKSIPDANISQGRNIAIQLSTAPVIAVTDGGSILDSDWFLNITLPLLLDEADLVGGFFKPVAHTNFQKAVAAITTAPKPVKNFLPSSRSVAFTRKLWSKVDGYPEWLQWGEDTLFNSLCIKSGARYVVRADAIVYWEVRSNTQAVARQFFRYALGDGMTRKFKISLFTTAAILLLILTLLINQFYVLSVGLFLLYPVLFLFRHLSSIKTNLILMALFLIWIIQLSRLLGFIKGIFIK